MEEKKIQIHNFDLFGFTLILIVLQGLFYGLPKLFTGGVTSTFGFLLANLDGYIGVVRYL
jgi:hypothetical protein